MKYLLLVGAGSFIGGVIRYLLALWVNAKNYTMFPWSTFTVNIIGCFLIGIILYILERENASQELKIFFIMGILSGFTTFSTFSWDTFYLFKNGESFLAVTYISASVILGLLATYSGYLLIKVIR